jgi:peptidyl-prolyl cis-trans isomerase C
LRDCPTLRRRAALTTKDRAMTSLKNTSLKSAADCLLLKTAPCPRWKSYAAAAALTLLILPAAGCSKDSSSSSSSGSAPQAANPNDPVIAKVNGIEIRASDLAIAEDDLGNEAHQAPPEVKREQIIAYVADIILVSQAAEKNKMRDDPAFRQRQAFIANKILMGMMLSKRAKDAASEEEMRKVYDDAVKPMAAEEEVRARHILVETEEEAKAILEQIKGGADFATLAKEKSKDPGGADGGDLGFFAKGQMVPEFSEVAFKMYEGQLSNPVKTQFGWHIIRLEEKRKRPVPEYDKVKDQIEAYIGRRAQSEFIAQLREGAKIERLDRPAGGAGGVPQGIPPEILQRLQQMQQQQPPAEMPPPPSETPAAPPAEGATPR